MIDKPKKDRWHEKPTPLMGGVGIYIAFMVVTLALMPISFELIIVLIGATLMFLTGFFDDIFHLSPVTKLIGQLIAALLLIAIGVQFQTEFPTVINIFLTLLWIVGITNAFNLIDNMDGLSSGVASISLILLFFHSLSVGNYDIALGVIILAGTCLGFLVYNFNPAKIFMGDCGSLFIGYTMAVLALLGTWTRYSAAGMIWGLLGPVMFLTVPIMDTTLVSIMRSLNGKSVSRGYNDHISHRLVAIGLSEKQAVLVLYGVSLAFGLLGVFLNSFELPTLTVIFIFMVFGLVYFTAFLAEVPVYGKKEIAAVSEEAEDNRNGLTRFDKAKAVAVLRRLVQGVADVVIVVTAYLAAYLLRFDGELTGRYVTLFVQSLPVVLPIFWASFWSFGLYRNLLRYIGIHDMVNIVKAVVLASVVSITALTFVFRFEGYPRSVFIIFTLLVLILIPANRIFLRSFHQLFSKSKVGNGKRKVAIYGAGDAGEMVLREIINNEKIDYQVVGFLDDDISKKGYFIHGIPIIGPITSLYQLAESGVDEVIIAMPSASRERREEVYEKCRDLGVKPRVIEGILS